MGEEGEEVFVEDVAIAPSAIVRGSYLAPPSCCENKNQKSLLFRRQG
ncbi:MAG: hypothetical protein DSM106950_03335 [Stigonema ocellatum SAG 48.90 = DSM 106950]|nr:hypothetical protein [Stigonema ocellatum SAG 48.90 = DSM 106950]